jgi:hypothetical protein
MNQSGESRRYSNENLDKISMHHLTFRFEILNPLY